MTQAEAQAELAKINAALAAKDPSLSEYRLPDGTSGTYDWPTLYARKGELDAFLAGKAAAAAGRPSRRVHAVSRGPC